MIRDYLRRAYRTLLPVLYARSDFKLLLQTSIENVDSRVRDLAVATDYFSGFLRPIPIRAPFGESMLIVAPHQDDEIIGCGGALALQARTGRRAGVVMLCDGAGEYADFGLTREELRDRRNGESRRAAALAGVEAPIFLDYPDLASTESEAAAALARILRERRVDVVFTPWLLDGHPEHRSACRATARALAEVGGNIRVMSYEVWGLLIPNVILTIDAAMPGKLEMLACFETANRAVDYVNSTEGLNMYRSRLLGSGVCKYAECFFEAPSAEYIKLVENVLSSR